MIEVRSLSHSLGEKQVLKDVNLTLKDGSVMGLVGINGAGKSTLLRLIAGVYCPDQGEVLCDGISTQSATARKDIFFLPDDPFYTVYTTAQSLWRMYRVFYPNMDRGIWRQCLQEFGLEERKPIRTFSKGMKRQLYVALALAARPKYLLLDEAFDGLDPLARLRFKKAINRAVEEDGTSVLISSHSLRELEDFCDSYALIDHMTVSDSGSLSDHLGQFCKFQLAFAVPATRETFLGFPVASLELSGRFARVILKGEKEAMRTALERLSPVIMEEIPMDFEELFISEVGERGNLL